MKFACLLLALACPLHGELLAVFQTSQGVVEVALQYGTAPQAVASFITLAEGSRPWLDSSTGKIRRDPFYNGLKIHRTSNSASFKFAQGGSPKGDGSDGPGYSIKDEFNPPLTHVPYVLSMANSGPNSNGSQFFFTGSVSQPTFDNVHTIFGLVTAPASQAVVDAMISAGPNGTTINAVTFTRTDAAAIAFNEHAQNLPAVTCPGGNLTVSAGVSSIWNFNQAPTTGAVFRAFRSTTMTAGSWSELVSAEKHVGLPATPAPPALQSAVLDSATASVAFYNLSVALHPDSVAPSTLANQTVIVQFGSNSLTFVFDASGAAGITTYTPSVGLPVGGPFTVINPGTGLPAVPTSDAHNILFASDTPALSPRFTWVKLGCNSATATTISCRHTTQTFNSGWQPFAAGAATITR